MLQSMVLVKERHDLVTEQQQTHIYPSFMDFVPF